MQDSLPEDWPKLTLCVDSELTFENGPYTGYAPYGITGHEALDNPLDSINTGQRHTIAAPQKDQSLVLNEPSVSRQRSGFEQEYLKTLLDDDIPEDCATVRFVNNLRFPVSDPDLTGGGILIFQNSREKTLDFIEVKDFQVLSPGMGYINRKSKRFASACRPFAPLEKGERLTLSPSVNAQGLYVNGVELNFTTSSDPLLEEDAARISESAVKKMAHQHIETHTYMVSQKDMLLNLYGDPENPKVLPDIGERVLRDGTLIASRRVDHRSVPGIIGRAKMDSVSYTEDRYIRVNPESRVLAIEVDFNPRVINKDLNDANPRFAQLHKFHLSKNSFVKEVMEVYEEYSKKGYSLSARMNQLTTRCATWQVMYGGRSKKPPTLKLGDQQVDVVCIQITTGYTECIGVGAKVACRAGAKNIVGTVVPDDWMMTDEQGFRSEFDIATVSVYNRMNLQQKYETFINRLSELVVSRLRQKGCEPEQYEYLLQYITDVCPDYGKLVDEFVGDRRERQLDYLDDVFENGIYWIFGKFNIDIIPERMEFLAEKYNYVKSKVAFSKLVDGKRVEFVSKSPIAIGAKQFILLGKIPEKALLAVATAHVNQFCVPVRVSSKETKRMNACSPTPINFGRDELGLIGNALPGEETARLIMTLAGCPIATEKYVDTLLTSDDPANIERIDMTTEDMIENSETIGIFRNTWSGSGYDMKNVGVPAPKE